MGLWKIVKRIAVLLLLVGVISGIVFYNEYKEDANQRMIKRYVLEIEEAKLFVEKCIKFFKLSVREERYIKEQLMRNIEGGISFNENTK